MQDVVAKWDVRATVRQARHLRSGQGVIRICWDLDNTLVNSGALLRAGGKLEDAIVEAEPVPNMLDLFAAFRAELPNAEHFILSARMRGMRLETVAWLRRHGLSPADAAVWFVPYVQAKPMVWAELARDARLVIVDDLSYNHEQEKVDVYHDLVDVAERIAYVHIGLGDIAEIARNPTAVVAVVSRTVESVSKFVNCAKAPDPEGLRIMARRSLEDAAQAASSEPGETRSPSQILHHYEVERELASRLRNSSPEERRTLYAVVYDELVRRVEARLPEREAGSHAATQLRVIERYLNQDAVFLDVGAGDCVLALAVAERVRFVHALEVSPAVVAGAPQTSNLRLHLTDGIAVPVPESSVTLAHSNQVLEHVHPDDALEHIRNVYRALAPGGRFVCVTPNRLTGPADISRHFETEPAGFHLREYTVAEVGSLMRDAGFPLVEVWTTRKGLSIRVPWAIIRAVESMLRLVPHSWAQHLGRSLPLRVLIGSYVVGVKPSPMPSGSSMPLGADG
jgi:SAM-dependent methyltransferase